jgi:hypothetical protein
MICYYGTSGTKLSSSRALPLLKWLFEEAKRYWRGFQFSLQLSSHHVLSFGYSFVLLNFYFFKQRKVFGMTIKKRGS